MGSQRWPFSLPMTFLWMLLASWAAFQLELVASSVHEYINGRFSNESSAFVFNGGREGMRASFNKTQRSYGASSIRFESLIFQRPKAAAAKYTDKQAQTQLIEAIIFEVGDRDKIGSKNKKESYTLCCTQELADIEGCELGEVIKDATDGWPKSIPIFFRGNKLEASLNAYSVEILHTGMFNLYFIFCDPELYGTVINGKTLWKNPTGYLPGRLAPLLRFYGFLSLSYVVLGLLWLAQYIRFWKDILQLQNYISLVIALGMSEMVLWYFDYTNFNSTGFRPAGITLWAVILGAVKKTVSRCLLLVVSMGYGVVKPTLGGLTLRVVILGSAYLTAVVLLDVVENVGAINDLSGKAKLALVLPVAILDGVFITWIFTSLSKTLEKLQARKLSAKLELYRKFTNALAVVVIVSIAWIGYELFFKATDPFGERWQNEWIIVAFWNLTTFILLCVICALWAPSKNATRYAYSEDVQEDFDLEETIGLTRMETTPAPVAEVEREKRTVNTDVFCLEEDNGEDKIE